MSLMVKPHIDTILIYPDIAQYFKSLMYYSKAYFQQLKEGFPNVDSINFPPHKLELRSLGTDIKKKSAFAPQWKWPYQVVLTTSTEAKFQDIGPLIYTSLMKIDLDSHHWPSTLAYMK